MAPVAGTQLRHYVNNRHGPGVLHQFHWLADAGSAAATGMEVLCGRPRLPPFTKIVPYTLRVPAFDGTCLDIAARTVGLPPAPRDEPPAWVGWPFHHEARGDEPDWSKRHAAEVPGVAGR